MKLGIGKTISTIEEAERIRQGQQMMVRNNSLRHGISTRESLVGPKKRSWDEKPAQMHTFSLRSPSQSSRASLLSAQSPPQSRRASPLSMQSPAGSRGASPAQHDHHQQRTPSISPLPRHTEQPYHDASSSTIRARAVLITSRRPATFDGRHTSQCEGEIG